MTRSTLVLAATLILSLGCMGGEDDAPVTTPTVTTTPETPAADPNATCCCEYTEEGASEATHSVMTKSSCESWSYTCVADSECEGSEAEGSEAEAEGEGDNAETETEEATEAPVKKSTGATVSGPRANGGAAARPGSGGTRVGGSSGGTRVGGSSGSKTRSSGSGGMGGKPVRR